MTRHMRTVMTCVVALVLLGTAMQAHARECSGVAKRMATGTIIVEAGQPAQQVVAARAGRCLLILRGWGPNAEGVNLGHDGTVTSAADSGFAPGDGTPALFLATEAEVWAIHRAGQPSPQSVTFIELFD